MQKEAVAYYNLNLKVKNKWVTNENFR